MTDVLWPALIAGGVGLLTVLLNYLLKRVDLHREATDHDSGRRYDDGVMMRQELREENKALRQELKEANAREDVLIRESALIGQYRAETDYWKQRYQAAALELDTLRRSTQ